MKQGKARITYTIKKNYESHLHSAGVNCLALDTRRGGRLYTGSRDSTINAYHLGWDEHLLNNNTTPSEESLCEISDGPSVFESKAKDNPEVLDAIHAHNTGLIPHLPQPQFKESLLNHSDWVNDMVLFNDGDNLLSASSDRTILLWSTKHGENNLAPGIVGQHHDYVKRIQYSKDRNWVTSGGLDEKIHIWDLSQSAFASSGSSNGSIYALAASNSGSLIVSGSPDKLIKLWDPSNPSGPVQTLKGHTDGVRDLLVSSDGRLILSASSDKTVKLWTAAMPNRCVATYSHFEDSAWTLYSNSRDLSTFWVGCRDGWVMKLRQGASVDCLAICKETAPVLKIAGINDSFVWTATTQTDVKCWKDVPLIESGSEKILIPSNCIIRDEPFEVADTHINSQVPDISSLIQSTDLNDQPISCQVVPLWESPSLLIAGMVPMVGHTLMNNRRHAVTVDAAGKTSLWDIIRCQHLQDLDVPYDDAIVTCNTDEWVGSWCTLDTKFGHLSVHIEEGRCMEGEIYYRDLGLPEPPVREDPRIFLSKWILTWLFMDCKKALYPDLDASKAKLAKPRDPASATILSLSEAPLLSQDTQNSISQESWGKGLFTKKNSLLPTSIPSPTSLALPTSLYDFEETPFIQLPKGMQIIISVGDAVSYLDTFRWAVETSECEIEHVPMWIYNWILMEQAPAKEIVKLTFQLTPHPGSGLPEMPKDMTKLTANKNLRVRKIFGCIEDNLKIEVDRESMGLPPDDTNKGQKMELLCQDVVLNPRHTIATVKKYFWKTGGDICITYRSST